MVNKDDYYTQHYLVCIQENKNDVLTLKHRFVLDGGPAFSKTFREAKKMWKHTSIDEPESLLDFLNFTPTSIVVNLTTIFTVVMGYFLTNHVKWNNKQKQLKFTSSEIDKETGLKANTLHYYIQGGAITPEIDRGEGTGKTRRFSETNFVEAVLIKNLLDFGLPRKSILKIFKAINDSDERHRLNPRLIKEK